MSLVTFRFVCAEGHAFEAPDVSGEYGEFVMRGERSPEPAYLQAAGDAAYSEVREILRELGAFRGLSDSRQAGLLQAVFGVACDPAPDGTRFEIGRRAPCPVCGTRKMKSWQPVGPYTGVSHPVTHERWQRLSRTDKKAAVAEAANVDRAI